MIARREERFTTQQQLLCVISKKKRSPVSRNDRHLKNIQKTLLLGPGPSTVSDNVYKALSTYTIGHLDPQFIQIMDEIKSLLKIKNITYDFNKDKAKYPNKLFVCDPDWLKISMYRELTEPLSNPSRLPKVGKRLELFDSYFKYNHDLCEPELYKKEVNQHLLPVLKYIGNYIKKHQLINFGATAHNFFVKSNNISSSDNLSRQFRACLYLPIFS